VLGGFLGSGKTTVLLSLAEHITNRFPANGGGSGPALAIIENEIGDVGIDNLTLESAHYRVTSLFSGCICCALISDLTLCVNDIAKKYKPSYIVIEATGLAYPDSIVDTIKKYSPACEQITSIVLADAKRWDKNMEALNLVISRQFKGADVILLNKTDTITNKKKGRILREVSSINPNASLFAISARNDSLSGVWEAVIPDIRKDDNKEQVADKEPVLPEWSTRPTLPETLCSLPQGRRRGVWP
jgi:G3E family GTPase